jgi:hypothetical protein
MRKNFHRISDPRGAVSAFLKTESEKGNKVYWDKGHIQNGDGESHNNPGVGIYCVAVKARSGEDENYGYETRRFMLLKNEADIEDMFTYYENDE